MVLEDVAVDVTQPGERDRQLKPAHVRSKLEDLLGGGILFFACWRGHPFRLPRDLTDIRFGIVGVFGKLDEVLFVVAKLVDTFSNVI